MSNRQTASSFFNPKTVIITIAGVLLITAIAVGASSGRFVFSGPSLSAAPSSECLIDTSQSDFQTGVTTNTDLTTSPGNVILSLSTGTAIDQQNTSVTNSGNPFSNTNWVAQTFTAGVTGQATKVDVDLFCSFCWWFPPNVTISIRNASGNLPTGSDLASGSIPFSTSGALGHFTVTFGVPPTLTAGTQYAIVVRMASSYGYGTPMYVISSGNPYAGGQRATSGNSGGSWTGHGDDLGFALTMQQSGYVPSGNFVSGTKDANPPSGYILTWSTLSWNATTPANTALKFQVAGSNNQFGPFNFVGPDTTASTFFTMSSGESLAQFNGMRYLKYKAFLSTTNSAATPTLSDVTMCFTNTNPNADLSITKTDAPDPVTAGSTLTYTITVTNAGPGTASNVSWSDTVPPGLTPFSISLPGAWSCVFGPPVSCSIASMGIGSAVFTVSATVNNALLGGTVLTNTATVTATTTDPNPGNNSSTTTTTVNANADLAITKTDGTANAVPGTNRSEERRVGKECRSRWSP